PAARPINRRPVEGLYLSPGPRKKAGAQLTQPSRQRDAGILLVGTAAAGRPPLVGFAARASSGSPPAGVQRRRVGAALYGRLSLRQAPRLFNDSLRRWTAPLRSLPAQSRTHSSAPEADSGRTRQRAKGSLHAALTATPRRAEGLLAVLSPSTLAFSFDERS